jgi:hypothetical protein
MCPRKPGGGIWSVVRLPMRSFRETLRRRLGTGDIVEFRQVATVRLQTANCKLQTSCRERPIISL